MGWAKEWRACGAREYLRLTLPDPALTRWAKEWRASGATDYSGDLYPGLTGGAKKCRTHGAAGEKLRQVHVTRLGQAGRGAGVRANSQEKKRMPAAATWNNE